METKICLSIEKNDSDFSKMAEKLSKFADVDVVGLRPESIKGYDIFIGKKMNSQLLATADKLKCIFAYKTGVDDFPLKEIANRGINVVNSHANADYIAQYAFGLSITLVNRIAESDRRFRQGVCRDKNNPYWKSIFEMKIGLVGFGQIGKQINQILKTNGIETYTINRGKDYQNVKVVDTLVDLCDTCDLIILSLPQIPSTDKLINKDILSHLKGKFLVNIGRGNCMDYDALYESLSNHELAGAAIDTWNSKPATGELKFYPTTQPFQKLDNILLSPHQAMNVITGHGRYVEDITKKIITYLKDESLTDIVDLNKGY